MENWYYKIWRTLKNFFATVNLILYFRKRKDILRNTTVLHLQNISNLFELMMTFEFVSEFNRSVLQVCIAVQKTTAEEIKLSIGKYNYGTERS